MTSEPLPGPPNSEPALRAIAMPADANANGDIFGGWLLSQMDLAGGAVHQQPIAVTDGIFTYVAIGPDGRPRTLPPDS